MLYDRDVFGTVICWEFLLDQYRCAAFEVHAAAAHTPMATQQCDGPIRLGAPIVGLKTD